MTNLQFKDPPHGAKIKIERGQLVCPDNPIIPVLVGDGIGPEIWQAAKSILEAAIKLAYAGVRCLFWFELPAGQIAYDRLGTPLPSETVNALREYLVGIKGPLTTPVGGGLRSLNVTLRRELDLYICMRPVKWIPGVPSPVVHPEKVDMVIFRENTEDIYSGIEFESGSQDTKAFMHWLKSAFPERYARLRFPETSAIGIKPISKEGSERLIRAAIQYALNHHRKRVTFVHKGNIMKVTEGAFMTWGYDLAWREFGGLVFTQRQWEDTKIAYGEDFANQRQNEAISEGKLIINDVITDAALERTLTRPEDFDILATTNLNGDYLSDALAAQAGGLGIAPGANLNEVENIAVFEAVHGSAPDLAGKNLANPCSLILSGAMLLDHIGWSEAADLVREGIQRTLENKTVTLDFHRLMKDASLLSTSEFGDAVVQNLHQD
jgi:isocitrate dehydrogenase